MNFAAFISYTFLTAYTPGPNNIMSMTNAGKYGFKKSFPFNLGIWAGFMIVMSCCAVFTTLLYDLIPTIKPFMLCIGAAYILWLAWTIWRDKPHKDSQKITKTNTFAVGMIMQFVNVKVIIYGITALSSFVLPHYDGIFPVLLAVIYLATLGFSGTCCWALFGAAFEKFFAKYNKVLNAVMALLLVYCAVTMLLDL